MNEKRFGERFGSIILSTVSVLTLMGIFFGAFQLIDTTYAQNKELSRLIDKVDIKILDDRSKELQQRIWELEDRKLSIPLESDRASARKMIEEQIREASVEKERVNRELDVVIQKYKGYKEV